ERLPDPVGEIVGEDRGVAGDLLHRALRRSDDGRPARHRRDDGKTEALVARREHEAGRTLVQLDELGLRDVAAHVRAAPSELGGELLVLLRADDDELPADGVRGVDRSERLLARLDRADEEEKGVVLAGGAVSR